MGVVFAVRPQRPTPSPVEARPGLTYNIRETDAKAWEFWGYVLYFVAKLGSPSNIWEVVYETNETCDTIVIVTSMG